MGKPTYEAELVHILTANEWFIEVLRAVRECDLPDCFVGAGVIRNIVWDYLHEYAVPTQLSDVDVVYFDSNDLKGLRDKEIQMQFNRRLPHVPWEVTNQARVHLWYHEVFGYHVSPLKSSEDAIATWPETATSIGVRLLSNDRLYIYSPFGLEDLFNMVLRRNPRRITLELYRQRVRAKKILEKWPRVKFING